MFKVEFISALFVAAYRIITSRSISALKSEGNEAPCRTMTRYDKNAVVRGLKECKQARLVMHRPSQTAGGHV